MSGNGGMVSARAVTAEAAKTVMSGPASGVMAAAYTGRGAGMGDLITYDMGGTSTDVALIRDGKPAIDPAGARVGQFRTMVEAVAMRTTGLGGDSEVHVNDEGLVGGVSLGPRRVVPISLMAHEAPGVVHDALDSQLRSQTPGEYDARFVRAVQGVDAGGLTDRDALLLDRIGEAVHPLGAVLKTRMEVQALKRLVTRGLVQVSAVTPSDASHVLGRLEAWDAQAAHKALELMGRRRTGSGNMLMPDVAGMAQMIIDQLTYQTLSLIHI